MPACGSLQGLLHFSSSMQTSIMLFSCYLYDHAWTIAIQYFLAMTSSAFSHLPNFPLSPRSPVINLMPFNYTAYFFSTGLHSFPFLFKLNKSTESKTHC